MSNPYFRFFKLIILFGLLSYQASGQSWKKVEALPSIWLTAVAADENRLWVAGTNRLYYKSTNASEWDSTDIIHPELLYISDIIFHEGAIFVTEEYKGIFKSEDQGLSWQDYNQGLGFTHIIGGAIRGDSIYIGTIGAGIFVRNLSNNSSWKTFSTGVRWQNAESITNISGTLLAGVGSNATLYLNKDQESVWNEIQFSIFNGYPSALLAVAEADKVWIAAGNTGIYSSSDKGQNWTQLNLNTGFIGQARIIYHNDIIYAHLAKSIGSSKIYYSSDNGITWNNFTPELNAGLDIIFWNDQMWYATQNGLWHLQTSTRVDETENLITNFSLYPNPFRNELNLEIEVKEASQYKVELHSISGSQSLVLLDKWLESGVHKIDLNSNASMSPGMYVVKAIGKSSVKSLKVLKSE